MKKSKMISIIAFVLIAGILAGCGSGAVSKGKIVDWDKYGSLKWEVDENNVLFISGKGNMETALISYPWAKYAYRITTIVIEEGVTGIGMAAFGNFSNLSSVYFPKSLHIISGEAFEGCGSLRVYYAGSEKQWNKVSVSSAGLFSSNGNRAITHAEMEFKVPAK